MSAAKKTISAYVSADSAEKAAALAGEDSVIRQAEIIDGKALAAAVRERARVDAAAFFEKYGRKITLAVVLVGNNPASEVYVRNKHRAAEGAGMISMQVILPENSTTEEVVSAVRELKNDDTVDGILVQLPLPENIDEQTVLGEIPAEKDVDGFHPENVGNLLLGKPTITACTPSGVMEMIASTGVEVKGKRAVVLGRSNIVGKPMALLLLAADATVTVCHSKTQNLKEIAKEADILVAAIGKPGFVTRDMVKPGAVVVDVGINRTESGLKGDVDFDGVKQVAGYLSPVPGGVGPMTVAMLLNNTVIAAQRRMAKK